MPAPHNAPCEVQFSQHRAYPGWGALLEMWKVLVRLSSLKYSKVVNHFLKLSKILTVGLLLTLMAFLPLSWLGFFLPKAIVITFSLGLVGLSLFLLRRPVVVSRTSTWVFGFFVLVGLYGILSRAPWSSVLGVSEAMQGLMVWLVYLSVFVIALSLKKEEWPGVFRGLAMGNALIVLYGLLQFCGLDPFGGYWDFDNFLGRPFSTIGNPNWLAAFLLLSLPVVYQQVNFNHSKRPSAFWLTLLGANGVLIFLTGSKAGILGLLVMGIGFLWKKGWKKVLASAVLMGLLLGLGSVAYFYRDFSSALRSTDARSIIWGHTLEMIESRPWGHGPDLFRFFYSSFNTADLWQVENIESAVDHPHNQFLQLTFEIGIWGAVLFYALIFHVLWRPLKTNEPLAWGIVAYLITNLFGYEVLPNGVLFWLFLGYLITSEPSPKKSRWQLSRFVFAALFLLNMGGAYFHFNHLQADFNYQKGQQALAEQNYAVALNAFDAAIQQFPYDRVFLLQATEVILASVNPSETLLQAAADYINQTNRLSASLDPDVSILEAWLASKQGDTDRFYQKLADAKHQNPVAITTYKIAAQIFKERGDSVSAQQEIAYLLRLLPPYWNNPETEEGRIFQKNHPWVLPLVDSF
ncbi:MAG: hypothetical protein ACD_28C00003G0006 [uncultured bacterium]|nr:MAG: hypothetical protein ACD_28C00003G0006 [uncultured bacterium]KKT73055.1 MAG: hypothetical protein UW70_C0092G0005 [Candidatus Peregrinibacteria bacterium GW2011_GWA2_44_7]